MIRPITYQIYDLQVFCVVESRIDSYGTHDSPDWVVYEVRSISDIVRDGQSVIKHFTEDMLEDVCDIIAQNITWDGFIDG